MQNHTLIFVLVLCISEPPYSYVGSAFHDSGCFSLLNTMARGARLPDVGQRVLALRAGSGGAGHFRFKIAGMFTA